MSEQNTADNWRLEDTGETLDQWKLQEAEQTQMAQWQLERSQAAEAGWQPVDYERQAPRRGSWVLPSLVGVALVAVFAYGVWIGLGALGLGGIANAFPPALTGATPTAAAAVANVDATATATAAPPTITPTVTVAPTNPPTAEPTATPEPLKVEQSIVRITVAGGVNGRREPATTAEVVQILPQGQEFLITETRADGWLQVALPTAERVWISSAPDLVQTRTVLVPIENARAQAEALGLPTPDVSSAVTTGVAGPVTSLPAVGQPTTDTQTVAVVPVLTNTVATTSTQPVTAPLAVTSTVPPAAVVITGTVNITAGLNARSVPTTTGQPVALLAGGAVLTITGRSADSQWLQIRLADNTEAWVFAEYIDLSATPITAPSVAPGVSTPITTTNSVTPTGTPATGQGVSASVNKIAGSNARLSPDLDGESAAIIAYDTVLTVRGRTADSEWLQVDYQGRLVWVLASTVSLTTDVASLPVITP